MKTSTWVASFAETYYHAYKSGLVLRVFSDSFKKQIVSEQEKDESGRPEYSLGSDAGSTVETLTNDTPDSQVLEGMPDWSSMLGNFVLDDSIGDWWHDWSMSGDTELQEQLGSGSGQQLESGPAPVWTPDNEIHNLNVRVVGNN
jgi:hypothetical protein